MAQHFAWLLNHRKLAFACVLFVFLVHFEVFPRLWFLHTGSDGLLYNRKQGQGMDHLPEDLDYRLDSIQTILSTQERQVQKSIFTKEMFKNTASLLHKQEYEQLKPLTAIIMKKSTRIYAIKQLVQQLLNYPFFREIIIYNTDPLQSLDEEVLALDNTGDIRVHFINVSKNDRLDDLSRFTLCASMASNEHCYFQDDIVDDVDVDDDSSLTRITYWDTLYINFLRYPSLIHANIQSSRYIDHYRWRFHNEEINMHAGYADLAFGAIVPRWKAQNFLTQLSKSGLGKERLYEADAYFAIWSNQYPWLLDNPLRNHASLDIMASDGMEQSYLNAQGGDIRRMRYDAARRLHRALQSDLSLNPKDYVDRVEEMPPMRQRDTRASCVTDRCLFFTNIDPIPPHQLDMIPAFDKAKYLNLKDWDTTLDGHLDLPKSIDWVQEGYHSAVDRRNDTCWTMKTNPRMNDYFGLITLGQGLPAQLVISTNTRLSDPSAPLDRLFKISILRNKNHWKACKIIRYSTSTNPISSKPHHTNDNAITDIHFELDCFSDILAITSNTADNDDNDYHQRDVIHSLKAMFLNDWEIPFS